MNIVQKYTKLCELAKKSYKHYDISLLGEMIDVKTSKEFDKIFFDFVAAAGLHMTSISPDKDRVFLK